MERGDHTLLLMFSPSFPLRHHRWVESQRQTWMQHRHTQKELVASDLIKLTHSLVKLLERSGLEKYAKTFRWAWMPGQD
jgi:hypothetical protein